MAYSLGTYYYIAPLSNPYKYLNRLGGGAPADNQDVTLYAPLGSADQRWKVELAGDGGMLISALSDSYGLTGTNRFAVNIWRGANKFNKCDIVKLRNNTLNDYVINLETFDSDRNIYRICIMHYNLYLTARTDGTVYWESLKSSGSSSDQLWTLSTTQQSGVGGTGGGNGPYGSYVYPTVCRQYIQGYTYDHPALDIRDKSNDHGIYAFADGTVSFVQNSNNPASGEGMWTMGNCIAINHRNPISTRAGSYARTIYMHMSEAPTLRPGDTVVKGQRIGTIGTTGQSSGNHLHFSVSTGNAASLAPGYTGWIGITSLPDFDPTTVLPEYYYSNS